MTNAHAIKRIGFYDSGLGGLFVMRRVQKKFPNYDYVFLADEKNLPYGDKSISELLVFARACVSYLLDIEKCDVVMIACNTLSSTVFATLESEYRVSHPDVLLLDVISPTLDFLKEDTHFSIFGTPRTIESHVFTDGIIERFPSVRVDEYSMLELASMIERREDPTHSITAMSRQVFQEPHTLVLACTHYGIILDVFQKVFKKSYIVSQDTIVVDMLCFILHSGGNAGSIVLYSTKENKVFNTYAHEWFPEIPVMQLDI